MTACLMATPPEAKPAYAPEYTLSTLLTMRVPKSLVAGVLDALEPELDDELEDDDDDDDEDDDDDDEVTAAIDAALYGSKTCSLLAVVANARERRSLS